MPRHTLQGQSEVAAHVVCWTGRGAKQFPPIYWHCAEIQRDVEFGDGRVFEEAKTPKVVHVPQPVVALPPSTAVPSKTTTEVASSSNVGGDPLQSVGLEVPVTPDVHARVNAPSSPRHSPITRAHVEEGGAAEAKRARTEEDKKTRINKVEMHALECEKAVRTV